MTELELREALAEIGRRGGKATQAKRTAKEKSEIGRRAGLKSYAAKIKIYPKSWFSGNGRKAANARWGRRPADERVEGKVLILGVWV